MTNRAPSREALQYAREIIEAMEGTGLLGETEPEGMADREMSIIQMAVNLDQQLAPLFALAERGAAGHLDMLTVEGWRPRKKS